MSVTVVWEAYFGQQSAEGGQATIKRIWDDMTRCAGYIDHETIVDLNDSGHVLVVSHWNSREAADRVREEYSRNPNALEANRLALEPRRRIVGTVVDQTSKAA
jgi:heme-degrading monooxygenase HmoA